MKRTTASVRTAVALTLGAFAPMTGTAWADAPDGGMETTHGPSLITIDNSNADSWLEVDRTANLLGPLSHGTAGSDHDGGGGAIEQTVNRSPDSGQQAVAGEQSREGEEDDEEEDAGSAPPQRAPEESAATGGDDPEGDADNDGLTPES